jgi:hypothetical protein
MDRAPHPLAMSQDHPEKFDGPRYPEACFALVSNRGITRDSPGIT